MNYESLSTVIILAIVAIVMAVWLPHRTVKGMKTVIKHQEDRYSSSLHLVDAHSGTRFSDEEHQKTKGVAMPDGKSRAESRRLHIQEVRAQRRAAIRRRRIIAWTLVVAFFVVLGLALGLHFSVLYALIPAALLVVVFGLGAHAASQARAWESKVAAMQKREREEAKRKSAQQESLKRNAQAAAAKRQEQLRRQQVLQQKALQQEMRKRARLEAQATGAGANGSDSVDFKATGIAEETYVPESSEPTDVMEQREIRQALHKAQVEKAQALAEREARQQAAAEAIKEAQSHSQLIVRRDELEYRGDVTNELHQVTPSSPADPFDMSINQDLISFSLGEESGASEAVPEEPESLPIKSQRQVAKAQPQGFVEPPAQSHVNMDAVSGEPAVSADAELIREPVAAQGASETKADAAVGAQAMTDNEAYYHHESSLSVEAPEETSESLGSDLASILARRGN